VAILVASVVVLAGFGFYHLFLFEKNAPAIVQSEPSAVQMADQETAALPVDLKQTESLDLATSNNVQQDPVLKDEEIIAEPERQLPSTIALIPFEDIATAADFLVEKAYAEDLAEKLPMPETSAPIEPKEPPKSVNLKVLKASVCADVQDRTPVGVSTVFSSSTKRVFVWSQIEAEQIPSEIRHIYYFEEEKISEVNLKVRSNSWRTWSYKTLPGGDHRGQWRVDIASKDGTVLQELHFTIN
jgi:hypothetical protein